MASGVRVFPEGVDRDTKGGELSKNETRRIARGMRRQIARRSRRKRQLRAALIGADLLPADPREQAKLDRLDPYDLRRRGLDEKLSPHEIGRLLIHINQRRGFQSNRRADRARKKENSDLLAEISALEAEIQAAGHRTLGEHLAKQVAKPGEVPLIRVRGKHTRRDMYLREFDLIWKQQQTHHAEKLTDALRQKLHRIIFFQRELYWPASVIGRCELEPRLPRCPRADRRAQRFRLLTEVNNLRLLDTSTGEERALTGDERAQLLALLSKAKELKFDVIRKKMHFLESVKFNFERGGRDKLKGLPTDHTLSSKDLFGKTWAAMPDDDKNRIVAALIEGEEARIRHVGDKLNLSPELIDNLVDANLEEGYSSYSLHAIKLLLHHLETGLPLSSRDGSACALVAAGFQRPWDHVPNPRKFLGDPVKDHQLRLTNPLVRTALYETRKVINTILRELVYKNGHRLAAIHIELAREARGTARERAERTKEMRQREAKRDEAANKLREHDVKVTRDAIDRYLLWIEQGKKCIYTGTSISITQLVGGEVDVDHVLPRARSLDNSLMNRVVCFRSANALKGDRTPHEWLAASNPKKYEEVLQRADRLPYPKARRFRQPSVELDDFFARQYVDTTYITTQVRQYVLCLGADVVCLRGQHTAELRHQWGLDSVLRDDGLNLKNREDHRHHAVDAMVIALTNRSRLQQLATVFRGRQQAPSPSDAATRAEGGIPEPWDNFRAHVEKMINEMHVSHRPRRRIAGALHEETIYGPTDKPGEFVYRKPIESLTLPMIEDIRDSAIRSLVKARLNEFKDKIDGKKIPVEVWQKPLLMKKSGVPVKKVRLIRRDQTIQPLRANDACVKPGSIHHICLFELPLKSGKPQRDAVFVSMLEAARRIKNKNLLVDKSHPTNPEAKFLMSIAANEMFLIQHNGVEDLYRFDTAASTSQQMWFRHHRAGGKASQELGKISKMPGTFVAKKVTVDPIGRLRWAND